MKYLLVLLVVVLVLWLMFGRRPSGTQRRAPPQGKPEGMVQCAHCGVHLPKSDALLIGDVAYCSAAHRDAARRRE